MQVKLRSVLLMASVHTRAVKWLMLPRTWQLCLSHRAFDADEQHSNAAE